MSPREVKVVIDDGAYLPVRAHGDDAGYDLRTPADFNLPAMTEGIPFADTPSCGMAVVDTGVHIQIPKGYCGMVVSKSGLNVNKNITVTGLIDSGYTGTIRVKLYNYGKTAWQFKRGDKIAQLVLLPVYTPYLNPVDSLEKTERGNGGFGSTGR